MNTRRKGKVILGFAIAAIIFASVFAMMIESVGAYSVGGEYNIIEKDYGKIPGTNKKSVQPVLIGQSLDFFTNWGTDNLVTIYRVKDKVIEWTRRADTGNIFKIVGDYWRRDGAFYVNYRSPTEYDVQLSFSEPDMPLEVKVGTKKVSSIAVGTKLTIDTEGMNLFPEDRVDLVVIGPDGQIKYDVINYQQFTNITVNQLADNYFTNTLKTNEWTIGDYAFWVKTNPEYACGLEAESSVKVLKILKGEIAIYAETTSTIELQTVKLAVTGVAYDEIKIESSPLSKHVIFKAGIDDAPITATNQFNDTIDADWVRRYAAKFNDTGTYTIMVTVQSGPRAGDYNTVDITVSEKGVKFDSPSTVVIGEKLDITGIANTGTYVDVFVADVCMPGWMIL